MTTAVGTGPKTTEPASAGAAVADVFVVFGISGDLAKVMTFNSLYQLERRGLLNCPIIGVAVNDWSQEDLRDHAHEAIVNCGTDIDEAVFDRLGGTDVLCERGLRGGGDLRAARSRDRRCPHPGVLLGDPAVSVRPRDQGPD